MLQTTKILWRPVGLADKASYQKLIALSPSQSADHAFANLYIWNETYRQEIAFLDGRAAVRFTQSGTSAFLFPIGQGPLRDAVEALRAEEQSLRFVGVTEQEKDELLSLYPTAIAEETRDVWDYLYSAEKLDTLSGKKLHAKKNHVNAFAAAHNFTIKPLNGIDFLTCLSIFNAWREEREGTSIENEHRALLRAFEAYDALSLEGALLMVDDTPVAFTIGSMLTADTLCVHFEKALPDYNGAFPTINREFVRMMRAAHPSLTTVNREDDMGLENLRRAKLSYRPIDMVRKFTVTLP